MLGGMDFPQRGVSESFEVILDQYVQVSCRDLWWMLRDRLELPEGYTFESFEMDEGEVTIHLRPEE